MPPQISFKPNWQICGATLPFCNLVFVDQQGDWFTSLDSVIFALHLSAIMAHPKPSRPLLWQKIRRVMWPWYYSDQGAWIHHSQKLSHLPKHLTCLSISQGCWKCMWCLRWFPHAGGSYLRPYDPRAWQAMVRPEPLCPQPTSNAHTIKQPLKWVGFHWKHHHDPHWCLDFLIKSLAALSDNKLKSGHLSIPAVSKTVDCFQISFLGSYLHRNNYVWKGRRRETWAQNSHKDYILREYGPHKTCSCGQCCTWQIWVLMFVAKLYNVPSFASHLVSKISL